MNSHWELGVALFALITVANLSLLIWRVERLEQRVRAKSAEPR